MIIITVALVMMESLNSFGNEFSFSSLITKKLIRRAYKTPKPADSVAVAKPVTTEPTTKTGIIRAGIAFKLKTAFSLGVKINAAVGYFFQVDTAIVIPNIRKPIMTPGIKPPRNSLPTDSSDTYA